MGNPKLDLVLSDWANSNPNRDAEQLDSYLKRLAAQEILELRAELAQLKVRFEFVEKTGRMIAQAADRMRDHEKTQDDTIRRLRANLDDQIACKVALGEDLLTANDKIAALVAERDRKASMDRCHACSVEARFGTEECPHPIAEAFHTCLAAEKNR